MAADRKFDDPLARPLARALAEGLDRSGRTCPGPEILALYFDRALAADEAVRWEPHFAACARCQELLAAMARMELAAAPGVQPRPSGFTWLWNWRWLAPAAAALGALVIWVVLSDTALFQRPGPNIARNIETASKPSSQPSVTGTDRVASTTPEEQPAAAEPGRSAPGLASREVGGKRPLAPQIPEGKSATRADQVMAPKPSVPAEAQATKVGGLQEKKDEFAAVVIPSGAPPKATEEQNRVAEAKSAEPEARAETQTLARDAAQRPAAAPAQVARSNEQDARAASEALQKRKAEPVAQAAEAVGVEPGRAARFRDKGQIAAGYAAANVASSEVVWRFGPSGSIERSSDAGATWQRQSSGVAADLLAGSAPTAEICWAVGRGGVVLRTTDGSTWVQLGSPTTLDLVSIAASDADHATVTTSEGKRHTTSDGGRTWRSL